MGARRSCCRACPGRPSGHARLCWACWRRLPAARRAEIVAADQRQAWHIVADLARDAAKWLRANTPAALADRRAGGGA